MASDDPHVPKQGWLDYGRNVRQKGFVLRLYLTKNPTIDRDILAGYEQEQAREIARAKANAIAKPAAAPDLFRQLPRRPARRSGATLGRDARARR